MTAKKLTKEQALAIGDALVANEKMWANQSRVFRHEFMRITTPERSTVGVFDIDEGLDRVLAIDIGSGLKVSVLSGNVVV